MFVALTNTIKIQKAQVMASNDEYQQRQFFESMTKQKPAWFYLSEEEQKKWDECGKQLDIEEREKWFGKVINN